MLLGIKFQNCVQLMKWLGTGTVYVAVPLCYVKVTNSDVETDFVTNRIRTCNEHISLSPWPQKSLISTNSMILFHFQWNIHKKVH